MFRKRLIKPFNVYLLILLISISVYLNFEPNFPNLSLTLYIFIHLLMIYILIYYFHFSLYLLFFFIGIIFDIYISNEIGPHLISFMLLIPFVNYIKKFFATFSPFKVLILVFIILLSVLFVEMIFYKLLFNLEFNFIFFYKSILILFIFIFPVNYLFNKIDKIN
ncbi:MAG: hypothetical protein CFH19_00830 [Alphaproteobacteria bacterium MarineAlpha5_Bin9]|nr:MAG: hypothetical protein CFH19_00830 [Alphaproteobacteria bacterium MarineAlpha5_Bin9]